MIPLLAGYAFSVSWAGSRYHIAREQGYHLYFRTAIYGLLMAVIASLIHLYIISNHENLLLDLRSLLGSFTLHQTIISDNTVTLVSIGTITMIMGLSLGHLLNLLPFSRRLLLHIATRNDDFERLVLKALRKLMPICVTMSNGKVYVGYVISTIDPSVERTALRILPLLSGYRDKEDNTMRFTTSYHEVYEQINIDEDDDENNELNHLEISDFEKVLPFDDIQSSHLFDIVAYQHFTLHDLGILNNSVNNSALAETIVEQAIDKASLDSSTAKNPPMKELR